MLIKRDLRRGIILFLLCSIFCAATVLASSKQPTDIEAAHFLEQASFGPTDASIAAVKQLGFSAYINSQFAEPVTVYPILPVVDPSSSKGCPSGSSPYCYRNNYTAFPVQNSFFFNAVTAPDQLRQRIAFALSQIFVVSNVKVNCAYAIREYQQMIVDNAFGNFRDLLQNVTLNPAMGDYLDMANNDKANHSRGTSANENYAREVLQLFTVGLVKLNADGTVQTDNKGNQIATYTQDNIENFARVFTGWTYPTAPGATAKAHNPKYYVGDMVPVSADHDTGSKTLFDGITLPAGLPTDSDLDAALDAIFNHPNVGPFIGKQLIKFLVTSNPSPAYVARVTAAFNNNGQGVRGDMKAVIRAILLDNEATGPSTDQGTFGLLREPVLFITSLLRGLGGRSDGVYLNSQSGALGQPVFDAPTVFNFYTPDYPLPGDTSGLVAPQFGIQNTTTTIGRWNFLNSIIYSNIPADSSVAASTGTSINWSKWLPLANNPDELTQEMDLALTGGVLDNASLNIISTVVQTVNSGDAYGRVRTAAYLIAASSQAMIQR
jgi:uncharacterized protein (DUF1800 family)